MGRIRYRGSTLMDGCVECVLQMALLPWQDFYGSNHRGQVLVAVTV
jgi:hypothetical protein